MINSTRTLAPIISQKQTLFCYKNIGKRTVSVFSFRQKDEKSNEAETMENQQEKQPDVRAHSFGEGYATRSDEDGFGGTNALDGNDAATKIQEDKMIHENHPVYDKTQGSEVAEKEKGRHQKSSS